MTAPSLDALRAALRNAEDELYRTRQSDDFCYTNGAYDRAERAVNDCRKELAAAEAALMHAAS